MFGTPPAARMSRMTPKTCALAGVKNKSEQRPAISSIILGSRHEGSEHGGFNLGGVWCDLLFH
jgi:hypothetical protein